MAIARTTGLLMVASVWLTGCNVIRSTPKYALTDGTYYSSLFGSKQRVYVATFMDTIRVSALPGAAARQVPAAHRVLRFAPEQAHGPITAHGFTKSSFDVDFLTIPFKYRPPVASFPRQFNTNLNGAIYLGYRFDRFGLSYRQSPLQTDVRRVTHYGLSVGAFTGLGATAINPWVTQNLVNAEYDGVVWSKGIAGIAGIDNVTVGVALGWDDLLDTNQSVWIYERRPWIGLAFGLNIN